jgi:hypothetical protein
VRTLGATHPTGPPASPAPPAATRRTAAPAVAGLSCLRGSTRCTPSGARPATVTCESLPSSPTLASFGSSSGTCVSRSTRPRSVRPGARRRPSCWRSIPPHSGIRQTRGTTRPPAATPSIRACPETTGPGAPETHTFVARPPPAPTPVALPPEYTRPAPRPTRLRRSRGSHHVRCHRDRPRLDFLSVRRHRDGSKTRDRDPAMTEAPPRPDVAAGPRPSHHPKRATGLEPATLSLGSTPAASGSYHRGRTSGVTGAPPSSRANPLHVGNMRCVSSAAGLHSSAGKIGATRGHRGGSAFLRFGTKPAHLRCPTQHPPVCRPAPGEAACASGDH